MSPVDPFTEYFKDESANLALELAREDRKMLSDLVALRKHLQVSQEALAQQIGVSQPTISEFERLGSDPKLSTIRRYARALGAMIRHQVDAGGVAEGSEDLSHFASSGVWSTKTAAAIAQQPKARWNSRDAIRATRLRGVAMAEAQA
ncbi:helix-turn-helix domain-containing protein [Brachybacterium subflavum]|uniref:helix-turn-helix domain-containing protein n=1 Tax=Brachybacterium subflavum TaxID=2585206 RepID=UPI001879207C|nr:helix-turn-helix transcriptional regulator [Brachybacterium subflavum]